MEAMCTWKHNPFVSKLVTLDQHWSLLRSNTIFWRPTATTPKRSGKRATDKTIHVWRTEWLTRTIRERAVTMAHRSMLWSEDSSHKLGRYWISPAAYGRIWAATEHAQRRVIETIIRWMMMIRAGNIRRSTTYILYILTCKRAEGTANEYYTTITGHRSRLLNFWW